MNARLMIAMLVIIAAPVLMLPAQAVAEPPIHTDVFSDVALQGHDPVAYFREGRATKGSKAFSADYQGATFRFASVANRDAFLADPEMYAPQYGGYCA